MRTNTDVPLFCTALWHSVLHTLPVGSHSDVHFLNLLPYTGKTLPSLSDVLTERFCLVGVLFTCRGVPCKQLSCLLRVEQYVVDRGYNDNGMKCKLVYH